MPNTSKLSKLLQDEMKRNDWSYAQLAEKLGVTKSQAHDWANGAHEPNLESLRGIAKNLKREIIDLIA